MAKNSKIEWTDHTFNPWIGCTKVSPGCANCYAETLNARMGWTEWGDKGKRHRTGEGNWNEPLRWQREAEKTGQRFRVFCASLADWLDDKAPVKWLADLLTLIQRTPNLDWLLLTKRPENWYQRVSLVDGEMAESWIDCIDMPERGDIPENIWIGTSVEDQRRAEERIPALMKIPAKVRFLSCEPLLGPVEIRTIEDGQGRHAVSLRNPAANKIHWVIAGGESGPDARPMHPDWPRGLRDQCQAAGVAFLFKQWGEWVPVTPLYEGRDEEAEAGGNPDAQTVLRADGHCWDVDTMGQPPLEKAPWIIECVGKKAAGRLLDGREWNEFPQEGGAL